MMGLDARIFEEFTPKSGVLLIRDPAKNRAK
jgi:hypothetical protein